MYVEMSKCARINQTTVVKPTVCCWKLLQGPWRRSWTPPGRLLQTKPLQARLEIMKGEKVTFKHEKEQIDDKYFWLAASVQTREDSVVVGNVKHLHLLSALLQHITITLCCRKNYNINHADTCLHKKRDWHNTALKVCQDEVYVCGVV